MKDERADVLIALVGYCVLLLWTVLPDRGTINPFPLNQGQAINSQTYVWVATIYAAQLMFTWVMFRMSTSTREFFNAAFILQACQFVEYFANYNATWFDLAGIPITVATLRFPILFYFGARIFISWKT
jgi:hypothetical protein